jgi:chaperone modulatory protein CbpM
MTLEHAEAVWLDERGVVTAVELTQCSGLTQEELHELVELGALVPSEAAGGEALFPATCIAAARIASRLRDDFEVDARGIALALQLLERVSALEAELRALHAQAPRRHRL